MSEVSSNRRMPDENETDERCTTPSNDNPPQATHGSVFVGKEINGGPCNRSKKKETLFKWRCFYALN